MRTHFEETMQRDIERIGAAVQKQAALGQRALRDCLKALQTGNRQLAYAVILRDQEIDRMEKEIDQLCLEFLVRQQPAGGPLRFAYATIRINLELERVGDYAESVARQVIKLIGMNVAVAHNRFSEIANLAIPMLHDAVDAFVGQDAAKARQLMVIEDAVDALRHQINAELFELRQQGKIPLEALTPLLTIARRFERVSDQAKNICQEAVYMCTGEYTRHPQQDGYRLLFLDRHNSCRSQMAQAIGRSLGKPRFEFESAGLDAQPIDPETVRFLKEKGIDISAHVPTPISAIKDLEHFHVVVGLTPEAEKALPPPPRKLVYLDWSLADPSKAEGSPAQKRAAYETAYQDLRSHLADLVEAILGDDADTPEN